MININTKEHTKEIINKYFSYKHLPEKLQSFSKLFYDTALKMAENFPEEDSISRIDEFRFALIQLLLAKDAYIRSQVI